jgi:hypothetical protein
MESTMSEAKYLRKQSQRAKADVGKAIKGIKKDAASAVNPRRMIEKHPWTSIGIAVVVGFIAAGLFNSPRRAKYEEHEESPLPPRPRTGKSKPPRDHMRTIRKWISRAKLIIHLVKSVIEGFLAVRAAASGRYEEPPMDDEAHEE